MNGLEERLREALRAHAEEFTAHPDAWRQLGVVGIDFPDPKNSGGRASVHWS